MVGKANRFRAHADDVVIQFPLVALLQLRGRDPRPNRIIPAAIFGINKVILHKADHFLQWLDKIGAVVEQAGGATERARAAELPAAAPEPEPDDSFEPPELAPEPEAPGEEPPDAWAAEGAGAVATEEDTAAPPDWVMEVPDAQDEPPEQPAKERAAKKPRRKRIGRRSKATEPETETAGDSADEATAESVPEPEPPPAERNEAPPPEGVTSLSQASFEELRELGMSVTQAKRIIRHRDAHGGFRSVDELDDVPGFPKSFLSEMKGRLVP